MSTQIFLSYNRLNASHAQLLYEILQTRLHCQVFMDVNSIQLGADFHSEVEKAASKSAALVVLIGDQWVQRDKVHGKYPFEDQGNWLRQEIALALRRDIRVYPVLLEGARMPVGNELPADISALSRCQALAVRDTEFRQDIEPLVRRLEEDVLGDLSAVSARLDPRRVALEAIYYFHNLLKLLLMPKRIVRAFMANPDSELVRAFVFLGISLSLYSLFTIPLYVDRPRMVAILAVQFFMMVALFFFSAAILQLSWWIVGGRAPFSRYMSLNAYYFGVNFVFGICLAAAAMGVVVVFDPNLFRAMRTAASGDLVALLVLHPMSREAFRVAAWIVLTGNLILLVWTYFFWGAYREINQSTRVASVLAFCFACVALLPVGVGFIFIQQFLFNRLQR